MKQKITFEQLKDFVNIKRQMNMLAGQDLNKYYWGNKDTCLRIGDVLKEPNRYYVIVDTELREGQSRGFGIAIFLKDGEIYLDGTTTFSSVSEYLKFKTTMTLDEVEKELLNKQKVEKINELEKELNRLRREVTK